jgi:hypothetical protein
MIAALLIPAPRSPMHITASMAYPSFRPNLFILYLLQ